MDEVTQEQPKGDALLLKSNEAAALIGVSNTQLWSMHQLGKVPLPIRLGPRMTRWRKDELSAWVRAGCPRRERWDARNYKETA